MSYISSYSCLICVSCEHLATPAHQTLAARRIVGSLALDDLDETSQKDKGSPPGDISPSRCAAPSDGVLLLDDFAKDFKRGKILGKGAFGAVFEAIPVSRCQRKSSEMVQKFAVKRISRARLTKNENSRVILEVGALPPAL